ncbi:lactate utilization protein B/C [Panacibacter ginsenosidivorans]|uniref:Lactate utilization protein B/C n=1 Tax=Panacibacter ginsenosidivorans TaxID=1813871 RepID=A0A5B8VBK3_9BACT|nr:LUD domain-containing protein [Panacibacter ginsenosidivorans]QEC67678.1 lactate utilization protein B/C [Panacibacter ginsenosidivorans]
MKVSASKEKILKKIRQALATPVPVPFPQSEGNDSVFQPATEDPEITFAENFTNLQGRFSYCLNELELVKQLKELCATRKWDNIFCNDSALREILSKNGFIVNYSNDLPNCDASITDCEFLVARTGSIMLSSTQQSGRTVSVYAPVHICIAYTDQLVYDIKDALLKVKEKYSEQLPSLITLATGPSRTADIEKTLVVGVHGPKEVFCFLIEHS